MASKPFQDFNQRLNNLYRRNSTHAHEHQHQQKKIYYYRKGRIPTIDNETQQPGYVRSSHLQGSNLKFSNDSRRIQAERNQLKREIVHLRMHNNEEKFFRKVPIILPKKMSLPLTPKRRVITQTSPEPKTQPLPILLRPKSIFLNKMKLAFEVRAQKSLQEIKIKMEARSNQQISNRKQLLDGLKGKCLYTMMRDVCIPNSFST